MSGCILITGGTGTFGKRYVKHILDTNAYDRVVIFSRDEYKQHIFLKMLYSTYGKNVIDEKVRFFLGDIRDRERLKIAMRNVTEVIHSAALKHVPFCEYNPGEAIKTNVNGTKNVCDVAIENNVEKVVVLSTDKAVEPINFYGSTKMLAENYAVYSNNISKVDSDGNKLTKLSCVRYGNIVGSRGSIVETFNNMKESDHFTVTDDKMTRFWMHIDEAVKMVNWTLENMSGGEIVIPKIKASRVTDIAKTVDSEKTIKIIGIRPGEKIHEQLFNRREHERAYEVEKYYVIVPEEPSWNSQLSKKYKMFKLTERKQYTSSDSDLQFSKEDLKLLIERENN